MGACIQSQQRINFPNLYKKYSPQLIENHAFAVHQLRYLQRRKKYILQEAKESVNELVVNVFSPIEELEEISNIYFQEKFRLISELDVSQNSMHRLKSKIQGEMFQVSQQFLEIKNHLSKDLYGLEVSICEYIRQKFTKVQKELEEKTIHINYTDKMRKELIDQFLQRVRTQARGKSKNSEVEIESKFRQLFESQNYLKAYNKVKFNFDPIYSRLETITNLVQNGRKGMNNLKKGKLKLILTQEDQQDIQQFIFMQYQSQMKQKEQMKEIREGIKHGVLTVKYRLSQISKKVSEFQSSFKEQNNSYIKSRKTPASSKTKR